MATYKFGLFGMLAFLAFVICFLGFAYITPGYAHTVNAISELGIIGAPYAKAFNWIGFGFVGLLVLTFAYGLRESLRPNPGATGISLLVA